MPEEPSRRQPITVTPEVASEVVTTLLDRTPETWRIMPIGGTLMGLRGFGDAATTKDVDVVIVTVEEDGATIPGYAELVAFARELSDAVGIRKDHTSVNFILDTQAGPVRVEFVRGRTPGSGGYFVSRSVLEACAALATERDSVLEMPVEALAFLKAWAAHDKEKLVRAGKDGRGYHARRQVAFLADVRDLAEVLLDEGRRPAVEVFEELFAATGGKREGAVRDILEEAGWLA